MLSVSGSCDLGFTAHVGVYGLNLGSRGKERAQGSGRLPASPASELTVRERWTLRKRGP